MSTITTRSGKGSPLTNAEVDANFTNLNNDKSETTHNHDADYAGIAHNHTGVYEPAFTKNTGFNKDFGTAAGTVAEGDHTHPISDVTNLQTTLDGKASTSHTHTEYDPAGTGVAMAIALG